MSTERLSSASIVAGLVVFQVATAFHPAGPDLNDNATIFEDYAESSGWVTVHLGQFAGGLLILGGLVALYRSWQPSGGGLGGVMMLRTAHPAGSAGSASCPESPQAPWEW